MLLWWWRGNWGTAAHGCLLTLAQQSLWLEKMSGEKLQRFLFDHLTQPARPIVAANGEMLDLLGQDKLQLQVGDLHVQFPVFIARELTQECLLGADFLKQHNCVINMRERTLVAGGKQVMCQSQEFHELMSVCHFPSLQIL